MTQAYATDSLLLRVYSKPLNITPPYLTNSYRQYKADTKQYLTRLVVTAKGYDCRAPQNQTEAGEQPLGVGLGEDQIPGKQSRKGIPRKKPKEKKTET